MSDHKRIPGIYDVLDGPEGKRMQVLVTEEPPTFEAGYRVSYFRKSAPLLGYNVVDRILDELNNRVERYHNLYGCSVLLGWQTYLTLAHQADAHDPYQASILTGRPPQAINLGSGPPARILVDETRSDFVGLLAGELCNMDAALRGLVNHEGEEVRDK